MSEIINSIERENDGSLVIEAHHTIADIYRLCVNEGWWDEMISIHEIENHNPRPDVAELDMKRSGGVSDFECGMLFAVCKVLEFCGDEDMAKTILSHCELLHADISRMDEHEVNYLLRLDKVAPEVRFKWRPL